MVIDITLVAVYCGLFFGGFYCGSKFQSVKNMFGAAKKAAKEI